MTRPQGGRLGAWRPGEQPVAGDGRRQSQEALGLARMVTLGSRRDEAGCFCLRLAGGGSGHPPI